MDDVKTVVGAILLLVFGVVAILVPVVGLGTLDSYNSCSRYEKMGIPVDWDLWGGCMANHPEFGWLPVKQYFQTMNLNVGGE